MPVRCIGPLKSPLSGDLFFQLSRNCSFADKLCSDFAEHESSESSHTETFYLYE